MPRAGAERGLGCVGGGGECDDSGTGVRESLAGEREKPPREEGAGHRGMVEGIDGLLLQDRAGGADRLCEIILLSEHSYNRLRTNTKIP